MLDGDALHEKSGKASFDLIYDLDDPREYFKTLGTLDYQIPQHGQRLFYALIEARRNGHSNGAGEAPLKVVDICCSYGINAAPPQEEENPGNLHARHRSEGLAHPSSEELAEAD